MYRLHLRFRKIRERGTGVDRLLQTLQHASNNRRALFSVRGPCREDIRVSVVQLVRVVEQEREWSESSAVKEEGFGWRLIVSSCNWLRLRVIVKEAVNKSNHPIQNPLLLVTEPCTRDNLFRKWVALLGSCISKLNKIYKYETKCIVEEHLEIMFRKIISPLGPVQRRKQPWSGALPFSWPRRSPDFTTVIVLFPYFLFVNPRDYVTLSDRYQDRTTCNISKSRVPNW
jgi:hypothetical protein